MSYKPDWNSVKKHYDVFNIEFGPSWFHDVKVGVIIYWVSTLYPVRLRPSASLAIFLRRIYGIFGVDITRMLSGISIP